MLRLFAVWQPKNLSAAQQLLGYHQIMILAKDNQFERAINYLKIWQNKFGKKLPLEFIMLNIYLHIKMGMLLFTVLSTSAILVLTNS